MFVELLDNVITFRKMDATLEFPTFEGDKAGDIWFQFKTTAMTGVFVHDTGETEQDMIQIRLVSKSAYESRREKTGFLHMRKQRRRSASR